MFDVKTSKEIGYDIVHIFIFICYERPYRHHAVFKRFEIFLGFFLGEKYLQRSDCESVSEPTSKIGCNESDAMKAASKRWCLYLYRTT